MQEVRTFRNSWPSPASSVNLPFDALHFLSGEQRVVWSQGMFPWLTTSKVFAILPTLIVVVAWVEYLKRTSLSMVRPFDAFIAPLELIADIRITQISWRSGCRMLNGW